MVRRAAAKNLCPFIEVVENASVTNQLFPLFKNLAVDDQDSVRLLAVNNSVAIAKRLPNDFAETEGIILNFSSCKSKYIYICI